jgi:hypothetical protein
MDVVVLSVDVKVNDGATKENKTSLMNRSDSWNSTLSSEMTDSKSSSRNPGENALSPTSPLLIARHCLNKTFGCRSASRHKIELYLHSLNRLDAQEERLECIQAVTGGEIEIIHQIAEWEEQILRLEASSLSRSSMSSINRKNTNARLEAAVSRIHVAAENADIPTIVQEMMDPIQGGLFPFVQELGIRSLLALTLSNQENKLHVVNCSGVAAVVAAMRKHTGSATLQRQGAALLLNLPFFFNKMYSEKENNPDRSPARLCDNCSTICGNVSTSTLSSTTTTTSCLDLRVVQLLAHQGALHSIRTATEENLFQVVIDLSGDESDNYVQVLAQEQIPALCQLFMDLYKCRYTKYNCHGIMPTMTPTARGSSLLRPSPKEVYEQNKKLGQSFSFIRRSLASLVDDPSIAPDTLISCLQNKRLRTD